MQRGAKKVPVNSHNIGMLGRVFRLFPIYLGNVGDSEGSEGKDVSIDCYWVQLRIAMASISMSSPSSTRPLTSISEFVGDSSLKYSL